MIPPHFPLQYEHAANHQIDMNFWRGLQDSITSLFTISEPLHESNTRENPNYSISPISKLNPNCSITPNSRLNPKLSSKMEVGIDGSKVSNERIAAKLKGYCDLAKEEIAKAIVADESGLINDAILHYKAAQRVLAEGASTYVPSFISSSEQQKVNSNRQEISKWQDKVSERLQNLTARAGGTNIGKIATSHSQGSKNLSKATNIVKGVQPRRQVVTPRSSLLTGDRSEKATASRSTQNNSGSDAKLIEMINTAIVDNSPSIKWDDVAGLDKAKQALREMVIFPTLRRDLFTGIRRPARGLLLYGPPGNGKTMLAKAVASECNATFFNVTASTLTSKWVGEGEKLVRTLFMVAISRQPSVIFMDEIDSMMSTREANEHDASRRLKSEFLVQFDGVNSNPDDLVIVIGATNKPQEIDSAVLRRMVKRIYIPLPDENVRRLVLNKNMKGSDFSLSRNDFDRLVRETEGYSASDLRALCQEAALMPLRELDSDVLTVRSDKIRAVRYDDFKKSLLVVRPSQRRSEWEELERWHEKFGSN